jgi:putative nucleotidyltransferase with HDIG domain
MKIYELIEWFQINHQNTFQNLKECQHNFDESSVNPYHIESDCWSHTMMVCKIAELYKYDTTIQIAALLHDIGKPKARQINDKNSHVRFFKHESISAYMALDILYGMRDVEMIDTKIIREVFALIALHSVLHKTDDKRKLFDMFQYNKTLFLKLIQLGICDNLGRFTSHTQETGEKHYLNISKNMQDKELKSQHNSPTLELLCGVSHSGKSTYLSKLNDFEGVVISRDALVMKYGKGDSYAQCWDSLDSDKHEQINSEIADIFNQALLQESNIIVDMMNLSVKSRKKWLEKLPGSYTKSITLFLTPLSVLKQRNKNGKNISSEAIDQMIKSFEYPTYAEADHIRLLCYKDGC